MNTHRQIELTCSSVPVNCITDIYTCHDSMINLLNYYISNMSITVAVRHDVNSKIKELINK